MCLFYNRLFLRSLVLCAFILLFSGVCRAQAPNSPKDPYTIDDNRRVYAGLPVPFGIILDSKLPITSTAAYYPSPGTTFGADFYYDAWQIGFHHMDYGNMVRLGARSLGRDPWTGWYIEYGPATVNRGDTSFSYQSLGIGAHWTWLWGKKTQYGLTIGLAGGSTSGKGWNGSYEYASIGFEVRVPISSYALTLEATPFLEFVPHPLLGGGEETNPGSGLAITASWAFNFEN